MSLTAVKTRPEARTLSAVLHAAVFGGMIFFAWWSQQVDEDPPPPFELVAGPGDNYAATQAPTTPAEPEPSVTLTLPKPAPKPVTPPPKPQPQPSPQPVSQAKPVPPKIERVPEPQPEPKREKVSFSDFTQQHGAPKPRNVPAPKPIKAKTIDVDRLMAATNIITTGAGGTAMTANEVSLSKRYVALIAQKIRASIERAGINDLREVGVEFSVSAAGVISNAKITRSSGSANFDRAVLQAFRDIRPIGPPPTKRAEVFATVIRLTEG